MKENFTHEADPGVPTLENILEAKEKVRWTLDLDKDVECPPEKFIEVLYEQINALPRTQATQKALEGIPPDQIPQVLFRLLQKSADLPESEETKRQDGVLIRSMKSGHLECAGRSAIASAVLEQKGIEHVVANAPGHTFLLVDMGHETLAYTDFNQNNFFMFPAAALAGFTGFQNISACHLESFQPRTGDITDGQGFIYEDFIAEPHRWGTADQYLQNVKAAISGKGEFETSGIAGTKMVSRAMNMVTQEILGEFPRVLQKYYENMPSHMVEIEAKRKAFTDLKT